MSYKKIIRYIAYSISTFLLIELLSGYALFARDSTYNGKKFTLSSINVSQRIVGKIFRNTEIIGVSRDSIKSHENFKSKQNFPFDLLSDPDEKVCKAFDVMKLKSMYGREYIGVDRSTFIINKDGKVVKEWRAVKVKGHVAEVLEEIKSLN